MKKEKNYVAKIVVACHNIKNDHHKIFQKGFDFVD